MTAPDPQRRRFLGFVAGAIGVAAAAALGWTIRPGEAGSTDTASPSSSSPSGVASPGRPLATPTPETTTSPETSAAPSSTTAATVATISAICREAWGAAPATADFTSHQIERLTVHHTAVLLEDNRLAPARLRRHQAYHLSLGWPDLAYHYMVDAAGNVYEGRPVDAVGDTATTYDPTGHFLVCAEGDFDEQQVPDAQLAALVDVLAWAADAFGVGVDTIAGHRDYAATTCPGDRLYPMIASGDLANAVAARLGEGPAVLETQCGDAAAGRIAAIESGAT